MLLTLAFCHILPEADVMFAEFRETKELAEVVAPQEDHHDEEEDHLDDEAEKESGHDDEHDEHGHSEEHGKEHGFPLAHCLFLVGFVFMLLLDRVLFGTAEIEIGDKTITKDQIEKMAAKEGSSPVKDIESQKRAIGMLEGGEDDEPVVI